MNKLNLPPCPKCGGKRRIKWVLAENMYLQDRMVATCTECGFAQRVEALDDKKMTNKNNNQPKQFKGPMFASVKAQGLEIPVMVFSFNKEDLEKVRQCLQDQGWNYGIDQRGAIYVFSPKADKNDVALFFSQNHLSL